MRPRLYRLKRRRLALLLPLCLLPMLSGCATRSTALSSARTERPAMPPYPAELSRRETLPLLKAKPSGQMVQLDRSYWVELNDLLAQALGALERMNRRNAASQLLWRCTAERLARGKAGQGCPDLKKGE